MDLFISDMHFNDKKILKSRQFSSLEEMNSYLIAQWNKKVNKNDRVFHLGDFSCANYPEINKLIDQLNGRIYFIKGNHDFWIKYVNMKKIGWIKEYYMYRENEIKIVLFHYPIYEWECKKYGALHFHGHIHDEWENSPNFPNAYNICASDLNYQPRSVPEIIKKQLGKNTNI